MKKLMLMSVVLLVLVFPLISYAGDQGTVDINAQVVGTCKFTTSNTTISVTLDPSSNQDVTGNGSLSFWCTKGTTYTVTDDDGLWETGSNQNRVKHSSLNEYIPYSFSYTPTSGTGNGPQTSITLDISATFNHNDYANASAGTYTDTVTITLSP